MATISCARRMLRTCVAREHIQSSCGCRRSLVRGRASNGLQRRVVPSCLGQCSRLGPGQGQGLHVAAFVGRRRAETPTDHRPKSSGGDRERKPGNGPRTVDIADAQCVNRERNGYTPPPQEASLGVSGKTVGLNVLSSGIAGPGGHSMAFWTRAPRTGRTSLAM